MDEQQLSTPTSTQSTSLSELKAPAIPKVHYTFVCADEGMAHWQVRRFCLEEVLSEPYVLTLELVTTHLGVETGKMLGASCSLLMDRAYMQRRVYGIVDHVTCVGVVADRLVIRVRVVPALTLLQQRINSRSWQDLTVPEILQRVLASALGDYARNIKLELKQNYTKRDFCVQYRESDFAFASRLMEEEGITYYFEQSEDEEHEILTLIDQNASDPELELADGSSEINIIDSSEALAGEESIQEFEWSCSLQSTSVVQRDFDWLNPRNLLNYEQRSVDARGREREVYEHGERRIHEVLKGERTDSMIDDGLVLAGRKLEQHEVSQQGAIGKGNVIEFTPGYTFELRGHSQSELDQKYLITRVKHTGDMPEVLILDGAQDGGEDRYRNEFAVIPLSVPFRPLKKHPKPRVHGPQTAIVTGPEGEEIYTDEQGRIKVLFHWDRLSPANESSSFWVRVGQAWSGPGWGTFFLPRIGMEVIVEFLEGNPDRPLVIGCVYNGANPTPYELPAEKTKSTIRSNSSLGGDGFNEFRFEDQKGAEEIYLHGQKDWNIEILNDKNQTIGNNETAKVGNNRTRQVGSNEMVTIGANKMETVKQNKAETILINKAMSVGMAYQESVGVAKNVTVGMTSTEQVGKVKKINVGGTMEITVAKKIVIKCGGSSITLEPEHISIQSKLVDIN